MAVNNSKLLDQQTVVEFGDRLQALAAKLAGFKPALIGFVDDVPGDIGNQLALLAGMADYMNQEICSIGESLASMGAQPD